MKALQSGNDAWVQRMDEAASWLQRLHGSGQDEGLLEEWLDWCQRDPANQQAFDELAVIWEASAGLKAQPPPASAPVQQRFAPRRFTRRHFAMAASMAGLGLAVVAGFQWWQVRAATGPLLVSEFSSPLGVNTLETLDDGSMIELGGGTRVTVSIGRDARRVELHEGEVFVVVRKDASRPFSVEAGRLKAIATGTEFNVLRTSRRTTVTVAEGSVDALYDGQSAETPNVSLQSSQQLVYSHESRRVVVRQTDPRQATAWRSGALYFQNDPLSEVIEKVNRYAQKQILIEDPAIAALPFTGTASIDRIGGWLLGLPHIFPVTIEELPDGRRLIGPKPDAGVD